LVSLLNKISVKLQNYIWFGKCKLFYHWTFFKNMLLFWNPWIMLPIDRKCTHKTSSWNLIEQFWCNSHEAWCNNVENLHPIPISIFYWIMQLAQRITFYPNQQRKKSILKVLCNPTLLHTLTHNNINTFFYYPYTLTWYYRNGSENYVFSAKAFYFTSFGTHENKFKKKTNVHNFFIFMSSNAFMMMIAP
jgi:hypothetical protein